MADDWGTSGDWGNSQENGSNSYDKRSFDNQSQRSGGSGGGGRGRSFPKREWTNSNRGRGDDGNGEESLVIYVQHRYIGKIIGRGGSQIRELQINSGAKINIDKSNSDVIAVTLTGSESARNRAKELIEELTECTQSTPASVASNNTPESQNYREQSQQDTDSFDWTKLSEDNEKFQQERWKDLPPMKKDFYNEDPQVAAMSQEEVAQFRQEKNQIECRRVFEKPEENFHVPNPVKAFEQAFRDFPDIMGEIKKQGFEEPSPIQCQAWPILLSGRDMIGIAQTGTGKTLAFLLPALIHIDGQPKPRHQRLGPNVLVMAPTRELALQINKEALKYEYRGIKAVCLYGGGSRKEQLASVERGVNIVIATPGRLNDLVTAGALNVSEVSYLVLDEADRMLDMGFEPQIRKALLDVRPDRQTVMTSATWPQGVRRLAQSYMRDPIQVYVGSLDLAAVHTVKQTILIIDDTEKNDMLNDFIQNMGENDKVIVFIGKKSRVDDIASELAMQGVTCQSIHGGRDQLDREQALEDLKTGDVKILLATDVASRGIDIEDVTHVFNYDFPRDIEEYVHRVGRTGRAGRSGESISLVTRGDWAMAKELISILEEASQEVPEELYKMAERYESWKERKAQEKEIERRDARGGGRYGGGGGGRYGGGGGGGGGGGDRYGGGGGGGRFGGGGGGGGRGGRGGGRNDGFGSRFY